MKASEGPLGGIVGAMPLPMRDAIKIIQRRVDFVLLMSDLNSGDRLSVLEIRAVRLAMLVVEVRKLIIRGDVVIAGGQHTTDVLAALDAVLAENCLLEMMRRLSESRENLAASIEDATRSLIATLRNHRTRK